MSVCGCGTKIRDRGRTAQLDSLGKSGKEAWQQYSQMLRGIMRKREEREKSQNYRRSTRSNASRFRADSEDEEVILVRASRTYTAERQSVRGFSSSKKSPRKKNGP